MFYDDPAHSARPQWPNDMLIAEERRDSHLMPLVYAHAAWGLNLEPAFMNLIAEPAPQAPPDLPRDALQHEWRRMYEGTLSARADIPVADGPLDPDMFAKMLQWSTTAPPTIDSVFAGAWDPAAFDDWLDRVAPADAEIVYSDAVLPALIGAWQSGVRSVTVLPLATEFGLRTCVAELVVSARVRESDSLLRGALTAR